MLVLGIVRQHRRVQSSGGAPWLVRDDVGRRQRPFLQVRALVKREGGAGVPLLPPRAQSAPRFHTSGAAVGDLHRFHSRRSPEGPPSCWRRRAGSSLSVAEQARVRGQLTETDAGRETTARTVVLADEVEAAAKIVDAPSVCVDDRAVGVAPRHHVRDGGAASSASAVWQRESCSQQGRDEERASEAVGHGGGGWLR